MEITNLRFDLRRVRPLDSRMRERIDTDKAFAENGADVDWPSIKNRELSWEKKKCPELEPNESDQFCCDFFLDPSVEVVFLYVYLDNDKKKRGKQALGWGTTAFYDLKQRSSRGRFALLLRGGES
jgi:hypothetical protein